MKTTKLIAKTRFFGFVVSTAIKENATIALAGMKKNRGEANPANMTALRARGAKVVMYHGVSDAIFSADDTRQWVERLNRVNANPGSDFARYFPVPGMNHCSAGLATDQFDLLTPLVQWVEQGIAPQAVVASARGAGNAGGVNTELPASWSPSACHWAAWVCSMFSSATT